MEIILCTGGHRPTFHGTRTYGFCLTHMGSTFLKEVPPPNRVRPVLITVLRHCIVIPRDMTTTLVLDVAGMIVLAFFFLLRPKKTDTTYFTFNDVHLFIGKRCINLTPRSDVEIKSSTFCSLISPRQKHGVRGEIISMDRSGDQIVCPVICLVRRILHIFHNT